MSNQDYVNGQLEFLEIKRLTQEQRDDLTAQKERYGAEKRRINGEIAQHRKTISQLETELELIMPSIPSAEYVHDECGLKTVFRLGNDTTGDEVYYCAYCNKDFQ